MMNGDHHQQYSFGASDSPQQKLSFKSIQSPRIKIQTLLPARQIPIKRYSIQPDMMNGWNPKTKKQDPQKNIIPILTKNQIVDQIINMVAHKKVSSMKMVYLGSRWQNSLQIHLSACKSDSLHQNPYNTISTLSEEKQDRSQLYHNNILKVPCLQFDSEIQSGNLDVVFRKSQVEYDLFMRVDTNTRGHTCWYNFVVKNNSVLGKIKFNIMNFRKQRSLYQRNMKPFIKSTKTGKKWEQQGQKISYYESKPFFYDFMESKTKKKMPDPKIILFLLHTNLNIKMMKSKLHTAFHTLFLGLEIQYNQLMNAIGESLGKIQIPMITIRDSNSINPKIVVITARVHPGESNSSFVAEGVIKKLIQDDPITKRIRKQFCFRIIPMLNPDGVIAGNYRTGFFGRDLNRVYNLDRICFPQITCIKKLIKKESNRISRPVDYYIDLHGHSIKKNIFLYGPEHMLNSSKYNECRLLAKHLSNLSPMFRYFSCVWRISESKDTTARAIFFRKMQISNCYTMQTSNGLYLDRTESVQKYFNEKNWMQMGSILVQGLFDSSLEISKLNQESRSIRSKIENRKLQQLGNAVKLQQKMIKCSDDQISEGDSDSQPQDNLQFDQLLCFQQKRYSKQKTRRQEKKIKSRFDYNQSQKHSSLQNKAKTILVTPEQQIKFPIISSRSQNKSESTKSKKSTLLLQKGTTSGISQLVEKRKMYKQQGNGFTSIMSHMVLNFSMSSRNNHLSQKSIKQDQKKPFRYLNRSLIIKQANPTQFIHNLKFQ